MVRYIDTASGSADDSLGSWLSENLVAGIRAFLGQTAWFSYGALEHFADGLVDAVARHQPVTIVVGANAGALPEVDLRRLYELIGRSPESALIVVRYGNATFHPKVFFVERSDGSKTAVIGSANLTPPGIEWNVEAGVVLDTAQGDDDGVLESVRFAIQRWRQRIGPGVFSVASAGDIDRLVTDGIVNDPQLPKKVEKPQPAGKEARSGGAAVVGYRTRVWKPPVVGLPPAPPMRWAKKMSRSDAQQVDEGTNPTGKLRLTKSVFDIDHVTYFRSQLFGTETWEAEVRKGGKTYEVAMVDFEVVFDGVALGQHTLKVDYALHRVADQGNVPTVLAWGHDLSAELAAKDRSGDWVTIERFPGGPYRLAIQPGRPAWAG